MKKPSVLLLLQSLLLLSLLAGCTRSWGGDQPWVPPAAQSGLKNPTGVVITAPGVQPPVASLPSVTPFLPATHEPDQPLYTPTPDVVRDLPTPRSEELTYVVQSGDTLGSLAKQFGVDAVSLVSYNSLVNPNLLEVGQVLRIPPTRQSTPGSSFKIIPDSELVYGPSAVVNIAELVNQGGGYLSLYHETVDELWYSGADVLHRISYEYSVNPRLLLAVLEYQSGWVTNPNPAESTRDYPMGHSNFYRKGLYRQLAWAANNLSMGYYLWDINALSTLTLADGDVVSFDPGINAGTAGVQYLMAQLYGRAAWEKATGENGVFATYNKLFGYPFDYAFEPLLPPDLSQPIFQLPFEPWDTWSFTSGPHGGWADGSAWAALDFAPPGDGLGCVWSNAWVVAVTDGLIVRSESGAVVQDLDGDGFEQTGWTILYMHIETRDRVQVGDTVKAGERIGHPSCEGGYSSGTHLHLARRYNGVWIAADGDLPFVMDGWVSSGDGIAYNGYMTRNGITVEAWDRRVEQNQISR